MPLIKFNSHAKVLTLVPFAAEKLLALNGKVKIHYDNIKSIFVRPTEAYVWANNVQDKAKEGRSITNAANIIPGRKKADLHLYSKARNVVGLDLVNHKKYGRVFFEVPNHRPMQVAQRIQQEIGLAEAIKDFYPTDKK
ncbi:hypothetical protein BCR33DRAFT_734026 [Rhizoclosmatium globosum]|uniref:Uncharacterized protein n=1 Tax=Rhizoclosmatium globosum TaxID=329046 RepID=A0A1Y2CUU2_9FUNG|nr:hypothetical protein HDU99_010379 [Rhizoclosmatium hyalinum]KAJ3283699.1 hypothetical protein HDU79_008850 [Rhizoclosmatium sp. JEL0117]ORY50830.1 hypothetical protein BCR33DRAFT_734026 [Rhizoclosmatium globosum]|eukprot:ORY50830.1 hypothetical protein BCR33DRAFT_734026 [Rhizoclosmatium globosum]